MLAKAVNLYCADERRIECLGRLFEYVTLSVMVRNGDAHLKNFGILYRHPEARADTRLAPLYDVVTTSAYDMANTRGETMADRTMALKMNGTKKYPGRSDLLEFGKLCFVKTPGIVIERIADAMQTALNAHGGRGEPKFLQRMKREWDAGRISVE